MSIPQVNLLFVRINFGSFPLVHKTIIFLTTNINSTGFSSHRKTWLDQLAAQIAKKILSLENKTANKKTSKWEMLLFKSQHNKKVVQSTLHIHGFCILVFNPLWIKNT